MEAAEFSLVETGGETKNTVSRTFKTFSRFYIGRGLYTFIFSEGSTMKNKSKINPKKRVSITEANLPNVFQCFST